MEIHKAKIPKLKKDYYAAKTIVDEILERVKSHKEIRGLDYSWLNEPEFTEALRKMTHLKQIAFRNNINL